MKKKIWIWMLAFLIIALPQYVFAAEPFELHLLNVGHGQSVLIEADGHYMLVDGGGRNASSFVVSYLKDQGIDSLDAVAVSHYDEDHMAGVIGVLSVFPVGQLWLPSYAGEGELYQSFAEKAISNGCAITHGKAGQSFSVGGASIEIVGPIYEGYEAENDRSLVFRVLYGEESILISGDAEKQSEQDMVQSGAALSSQIYVVGHHGSSSSSSDAFLDAVSPAYAIISCGKDNSYGHPTMEALQRLQNHGVSMFRTDQQGTVVAFSDGYSLWFNVDPSDDWTARTQNTDSGNEGYGITPEPIDAADAENQTSPGERSVTSEEESEFQYVCNTNTRKFHFPNCNSVLQMNEENRLYTNLSREELLAEGYEPCGNCRP